MFIMSYKEKNRIRHSPLFVISFRLIVPRRLLEAQNFKKKYHSYKEINSISDRLKFCRYKLGLMQKEVAKITGISKSTYMKLESGNKNTIDINLADKLAKLYNIPVNDVLDDYNCFILYGQGELIRNYRKNLNIGKRTLAKLIGAQPTLIRLWENEQKQISLKSWEKYFRDRISIPKLL